MRKIENGLRCRKRDSTRTFKDALENPIMNKYRVILTFFIIGCLSTFLIAGVRDAYAAGISIPVRVNYGSVPVGGPPVVKTIIITNTGKGTTFTITGVPKWAPPDYHWWTLVPPPPPPPDIPPECSGVNATLTYNQSCSLTYSFSPPAINSYDYTLNITYTYDYKTFNNANTHFYGTGTKGTPIIIWSNPADIIYGTPLGPTQLNATAQNASGSIVPGSFNYTPPAGTVLNAGQGQTLSVTFTPTDTVNYNTATKTVQINVLKAAATVALSNLTQAYTGSPLTPTATTTPAGLNIVWTGAPQTNVGSYEVTATINDLNYLGSATGTLVISKATATVALSNMAQAYTGSPLTPIATTVPAGLDIIWTGAPQTNAGSYQVTATINDPNYTGSASGTFVILIALVTKSKTQIEGYLICTEFDLSTQCPKAMYRCPINSDCSTCMTETNRCGNTSLSGVAFNTQDIIWVGQGADNPTCETAYIITSSVIYRCIEGVDYCFQCGGGKPDTGDLTSEISSPPVTVSTQQKIGDVWVCAERPPEQESPCFQYPHVYSCPDAPDTDPCGCAISERAIWNYPLPLSDVAFTTGTLDYVGLSYDDIDCDALYLVTAPCIYKCIVGEDKCFTYGTGCPPIPGQ